MALRELTKEYLTKAVYQTPLEIVRLMAEALPLGEGTVLDICGGSEEFLLRAAAMKQKKSEEELLVFENWTGAEDTSDGRENFLVCGPTEKAAEYFKKKKGKKANITKKISIDKSVACPVKKGEKVGMIHIYNGKKKIGSYPLVSDRDAEKAGFMTLYIRMIKNLV